MRVKKELIGEPVKVKENGKTETILDVDEQNNRVKITHFAWDEQWLNFDKILLIK